MDKVDSEKRSLDIEEVVVFINREDQRCINNSLSTETLFNLCILEVVFIYAKHGDENVKI